MTSWEGVSSMLCQVLARKGVITGGGGGRQKLFKYCLTSFMDGPCSRRNRVEKPWSTLSPASCCSLDVATREGIGLRLDRANWSTLAHPSQMEEIFFRSSERANAQSEILKKKEEKKTHFLSDHLIHFSLLRIRFLVALCYFQNRIHVYWSSICIILRTLFLQCYVSSSHVI